MPRNVHTTRHDEGYSLIECLLAAGLLTGVLLSITGLFIVGSSSVKSGRELTKATTIGNSAMEQVMGWPFDSVYGFVGGVATDQTKTWITTDANPTYTGSAEDIAVWTAVANSWRTDVQTQLPKGKVTIKVDGMGALPTSTSEGRIAYQDAQFLRVTVTVAWTERSGRLREVVFEEITL